MNKYVIGLVTLLVGLGLGFAIPHGAKPAGEQVVGAAQVETNSKQFAAGLSAGTTEQWSVDTSGNESTSGTITASALKLTSANYAVSSSSPAALGAATRGQFVVAAAATTANASTTALGATSLVFLQNSATTTIPGVTCNTSLASSTQVSTKIVGNGFIAKVSPAPTTNPYCFDFHIINP